MKRFSFSVPIFATLFFASLFCPLSAAAATSEALKGFGEVMSVFVNIFTFLAFLVLNYLADLLNPDILIGEKIMESIRPMWVLIRNFTNIGFVIVLLYLSFSNLVAGVGGESGGGNWTIKDKLPKIILALIAINFSLLGFRVAIDAVHVGTVTVFSLADTALEAKLNTDIVDSKYKTLIEEKFDENGYKCTAEEGSTCKPFKDWINGAFCEKDANGEILKSTCFFSLNPKFQVDPKSESAHNLFLAFGIYFQHLEKLPVLAAQTDDWTKVLDSTIFSFLMALSYIIVLVGFLIVLIVRVMILWAFMIFSPALVAAAIMGFQGSGESNYMEKLVTHLLIPLKVAAAFTIGFILISAMVKIKVDLGGDEASMLRAQPALTQFGGIWGILWQVMSIVLFWKVAWWSLEGTEAKTILEKVKGGSEMMFKYGAKVASVDNIKIPIGGGDGVSLSALSTLPTTLDNARNREIGRQTTSLAEALDLTPQTSQAMKDAQDKMIRGIDNAGGALRAFNDHLYSTVKQHGTDAINNLAVDRMVAKIDGDNTIQWGDNAKSKSQISAALKSGNHTQILNGLENLRQVIGNTTVSQADIQALSESSAASASGDSASGAGSGETDILFQGELDVGFSSQKVRQDLVDSVGNEASFSALGPDEKYERINQALFAGNLSDADWAKIKDKGVDSIVNELKTEIGGIMNDFGISEENLQNAVQAKLNSLASP